MCPQQLSDLKLIDLQSLSRVISPAIDMMIDKITATMASRRGIVRVQTFQVCVRSFFGRYVYVKWTERPRQCALLEEFQRTTRPLAKATLRVALRGVYRCNFFVHFHLSDAQIYQKVIGALNLSALDTKLTRNKGLERIRSSEG